MLRIKVNLKRNPYDILIGRNIINALGQILKKLNLGSDAYIVTTKVIKYKYGNALAKTLKKSGFTVRFKVIPDTEKSKSLKLSFDLIKDLANFDKGRRIFVIAFGGGVVGDLSGFVASIYKRGIAYIQIPTTLLAQVDSSIGGKTAVDLTQGKNLVGAFYQPRFVLSDISYLKSLNSRQMLSGLAEVIKYGIIKDRKLFSFLEKRVHKILDKDHLALEHVVKSCGQIKADIVQKDEMETKGIRTILNFGHTIGHAIEAAAGYKLYNHGEAIALGMLIAKDISYKLGLINDRAAERIEFLIRRIGLPSRLSKVSLAKIISAHYKDKKFIGNKNRLVLIEDIGRTKIVENIPLAIIESAVKNRFSKVTSRG